MDWIIRFLNKLSEAVSECFCVLNHFFTSILPVIAVQSKKVNFENFYLSSCCHFILKIAQRLKKQTILDAGLTSTYQSDKTRRGFQEHQCYIFPFRLPKKSGQLIKGAFNFLLWYLSKDDFIPVIYTFQNYICVLFLQTKCCE